jgi:nitrite reductase (NO-forming)
VIIDNSKTILIFSSIICLAVLLQLPSAQSQLENDNVKKVLLIADERPVNVAPDNALHPGGITYNAMTFNGTIPGPVIAIDENDTLEITLKNDGTTIHSLNFQAGYGPDQAVSGSVKPGESKTWTLKGEKPGAFLYQCTADSLNGIWENVANGMYGAIIVHPPNEKPAKEFYMVFSEIYNQADKGLFTGSGGVTGSFDIAKFIKNEPDLVLTNGMSFKYLSSLGQISKIELNKEAEVFKVKPGELTRWYIANAGPRGYVAFSFMGGMIDVRDGSISGYYGLQLKNDETWTIPTGSVSVIESIFPSEGLYIGHDQDLGRLTLGGAFAVLSTGNATESDHPSGTWVPPANSDFAQN